LNNNQSSPNAISHKELNDLMTKAKKKILAIDTDGSDKTNDKKEFYDLITDWTNTSQKILLILNQKDQALKKFSNTKSLLAFGAMGAHINMALQALKATEFDQ
tara:strand:- start:156 stop:464 length:309 start_codon:yes stop_codon:yes gene_type:complete